MKIIKKIVCTTIIILLILIGTKTFDPSSSCGIPKKSYSVIKIIKLSKPSDSRMVVYETTDFIVSFGFNDFESNLKAFIKKHNIYNDKELLFFIKKEGKKKNQININNVPKEWVKERAKWRVADLLQTGKLTLFDKKKNIYIKEIKVEEHGYSWGALSGQGGRRYIIFDSDYIFFEVIDWIS